MSLECPVLWLGTAAIIGAFPLRRRVVVTYLIVLLLPPAAAAAQALTLDDLLAAAPDDVARVLESARPAAVSAALKTRVLASLPDHGEITHLDAASRLKVEALVPVLRVARREAVYEIRVIDLPQAVVGLYAGTVILVSHPAVTLLSAGELRAVVAHEVGHEYVSSDYERAARLGDNSRLQQLELVCDAVAVVTLRAIGHDATDLLTGLAKLIRFNHRRFGEALDEGRYPSLARRLAIVRSLESRLGPLPAFHLGSPQ